MSNKHQIELNYQRALQQAKEIKQISSRIKKLSDSELGESVDSIDKNWDGESSDRFVSKGRVLESKITDSASDMLLIANAIETIARNIYETEKKAIEIVQTQGSN